MMKGNRELMPIFKSRSVLEITTGIVKASNIRRDRPLEKGTSWAPMR